MKLIVEDDRDICRAHILKESVDYIDDGKYHPFMISGVFGVSERKNKNGRIYPYEMLKNEFDRYIKEDIASDRAYGQFEHPTKQCSDQEERELACIKITEAHENTKEKWWEGKAQLCCSDEKFGIKGFPKADLARSYYNFSNESIFGFSTRGYGDLSEPNNGVQTLLEYHMTNIDLVLFPSSNMYANGILESKEFMIDMHGQIVECAFGAYERKLDSSTKTFDLSKKREIINNALQEFLKKI